MESKLIGKSTDRADELLVQSDIAILPTIFGQFKASAFGFKNNDNHLFLEYGTNPKVEYPIVRVQSECVTSEVFGSLKCDCREQLHQSIDIIKKEGYGIIVYMRQEGRGIGLFNKINAYKLQEKGFDTIEANHQLNLESDLRDYKLAYMILKKNEINNIRLISNNSEKIDQLRRYGIEISSIINTKANINPQNEEYIKTKIKKLNHQYLSNE